MFNTVTFLSAPASWPPAADCYRSLPLLGQQQEELQRDLAAPWAPEACLARAPATSTAQLGSPTGQAPRCGLLTRTSAPAEQLLSHRFPPHLLCRITPLRTHNHQVDFSPTRVNKYRLLFSVCVCMCCNVCMFFLAAHDGDSVIIVNELKGKKQDSSRSVFVFSRSVILFLLKCVNFNVLFVHIVTYFSVFTVCHVSKLSYGSKNCK